METKVTSPAIKGLIISLILVVVSTIIYILKMETNKSLSIVSIAIFWGGLIWSVITFAKQNDGNVTFGNCFGHGFKITAIVAAVMGLWLALSLGLIFPDALDRAMEVQRQAMEAQGKLSEAEIDKYMTTGKKLALPMGTIVSTIFNLILGAFGSLIGAAAAKKNPTPQTPFQ
ncbi:MAG TPA: DUF4199 domain-containing protein [Phnomibacter sp.]|nr:DUF4199 domain-containing protein [Phnomibacter sp.]